MTEVKKGHLIYETNPKRVYWSPESPELKAWVEKQLKKKKSQ